MSPQTAAKIFFFVSGATALVYEVVWLRILGLVFGNTTHALSTVLAAYMAGLGAGSFWMGRRAASWKSPLRVYGFLEAGIGAYAALTPLLARGIQAAYLAGSNPEAPHDARSLALKFLLSFAVVFLPTFFMGGTLPVLAKFFLKDDRSAGPVAGLLYGLNTAGAVAGTLLAGFWMLPVLGLNGTLWTCVFLNFGIGALALLFSSQIDPGLPAAVPDAQRPKISLVLPLGLFISGFNAMLYEIGWTRILATVLSSSTYAFTIMLAAFLAGIALGSWTWKRVMSRHGASGLQWGWLQLLIAAASFLALPAFPWVNLFVVRLYGLTVGHPHLLILGMSLVCVSLMIVPAFGFGALFPLSSALFIQKKEEAARKIGVLYLWNTAGNIAGSLAAGFWLIPAIGIYKTALVAVGTGALLSGAVAWVVARRPMQNAALFLASMLLVLAGFSSYEKGWDARLLSSGLNIDASLVVGQKTERILSKLLNHRLLYYREGLNSIVSVGQEGENIYLKVNGKTDASTRGDTATQLLLGHLPHLLHLDPKRSLVIGYGSGMTLAAALAHPVQSADSAEIEPAVMEASKFFAEVNRAADEDPRVRILQNDGRNHLLMEKGVYDVIVSEPSNPWMAGVSYLFTTDFYRLADRRLAPGGVFCQWIHAYAIRPEDFWMVVASVRRVFPHVTLWRASADDYLILAQREPFTFDLDRIDRRLAGSERVRKDLGALGITGAAGLLARFQAGEATVEKYAAQAGINDDNFLPLEFSTPLSLYDASDALTRDLEKMAEKEPLPPVRSERADALKQPEAFVQIGKALLGMEEPARAESWFSRAPDDPDAQTGVARCLALRGQEAQAMRLFEKAQTAEAHEYLGRYDWKEGEYARSLERLELSLSKNAENWEAHYWRGQSLEKLGRWDEAAAAYDEAEKILGPRLGVRLARASARRRGGRTDEALKELEKLREEFPLYYPIYAELKAAYLEKPDLETPIRHYEYLVKQNPYFEAYWIDLIGLYLQKNDTEKVDWAAGEALKARL